MSDQGQGDFSESGFLKSPVTWVTKAQPQSGDQVGSYCLVRQVGEGGMGSVWLAERDGDFHQRVAIKLLRLDRSGGAAEGRFGLERKLLAQLEHPGIARLIDGGTLEDGSSFLAMEYVEGEPLDRWVARQESGVDDVLDLMALVCDAVEAAHEKGIVHRDLKPSNILVMANGKPKLLDFGIAKLLVADDGDATLLTQTGDRLLTPRYASPEQVNGGRVTVATDVYGLGVLLYELLAGRAPHGDSGTTWHDLQESILHEPAAKPSAVADRSRRTRLRGDLDVILLRSLAKDPARRYQSAGALAEDLRRHRAYLPIKARPDSAAYLVTRFIRRHRVLVAATVMVTLSLAVGLVVASVNVVHAAEARDEAELRKAITDGVNEFLTEDLLRGADPSRSHMSDITMRAVLDLAATRIEGRFPDAPLVEAAVHYALGGTYISLGLFKEAEPHCRRAVYLRKDQLGELSIETFEAERDLGLTLGYTVGAEEEIQFEEELLERMDLVLPLKDGYRMVVASNLSQAYAAVGRLDEAIAIQRELLALRLEAFGERNENTLSSYNQLGVLLADKNEMEESLSFLTLAASLRAELLGEDDPATLRARGNVASLQFREGHYSKAVAAYKVVYASQVRVLGATHHNALTTINNIAVISYLLKDYAAVLDWAERGRQAAAELGELDSAFSLKCANFAVTALLALEEWESAEGLLGELLSSETPDVERAAFELQLVATYEGAGRLEEAEELRALIAE